VAPVATVAKWFPDKKGLVTGMVVMGFGLGALVMSKLVAPALMAATGNDLPRVFLRLGIALGVLAPAAGAFLRDPPARFSPSGNQPGRADDGRAAASDSLTAADALLSRRFVIMWLFFFCNICAGIMFIGLQSPMLQDVLKARAPYATLPPDQAKAALAAAGATLIAGSSLCNGLGRLFWGALSDKLGRIVTFRIILGTQVLAFVALMFVDTPAPFCALVGYVLLCYGGGFGTAPATVLSAFGARLMPTLYGILLTAWSTAGIVGPQVAAAVKDRFPGRASLYTYAAAATILAFGFVLSCLVGDQPLAKAHHPR
jgi:OFA family oxalate/formate antiporter-like MFS transporter